VTVRLVVFAKPPLAGVARSRLAHQIGGAAAASVAEALALDTVALCEAVGRPRRSRVANPPMAAPQLILAHAGGGEWFSSRLSRRWQLLRQRGQDPSERLDSALADLSLAPGDRTAFIGMDAPHVPPGSISRGFRLLQDHDTVLGPCEDGSYWLIGVGGAWPPGTLAGVRWGSEHTLCDTRLALERAGMGCALLPASYGVADLAGLRRLAEDAGRAPARLLGHSRRVLADLGPGQA